MPSSYLDNSHNLTFMYQNIKDDVMSDNAVAVLAPNSNGVSGVVYFIQDGKN